MCDFKKYQREQPPAIAKFRRAVEHIIILNKLNKSTKSQFLDLLVNLQMKIKIDKLENKKKRMRKFNNNINNNGAPTSKGAPRNTNGSILIANGIDRRKSHINTIAMNANRLQLGQRKSILSTNIDTHKKLLAMNHLISSRDRNTKFNKTKT